MFNISLGLVSWWTTKDSERYNRLIQLRVFAFCVNILHAYITGPVVTQTDEAPEKIAASKAGRNNSDNVANLLLGSTVVQYVVLYCTEVLCTLIGQMGTDFLIRGRVELWATRRGDSTQKLQGECAEGGQK